MIILKTRYQRVEQISFSQDGRGLAAAGELGVWWWKSIFDATVPTRLGEKQCGGLGFDPRTEHLIAVQSLVGLLAFNLSDQSQHTVRYDQFNLDLRVCPMSGIAIVHQHSYHRRSMASHLEAWRLKGDDGFVRIWDIQVADRSIGSFISFAASGEWFVWAEESDRQSPDFRLVFREAASGRVLRKIRARDLVSCTPAVSKDGSRIAYGSRHFVYGHWTDDTERWVVAENDCTHQYTSMEFHPSGRFLATTNNDQTVKFYNTQTWELAKTFTWDIGRMRSIAFSPDGTLAAAGSDTGKVVVWDVDV